MIRRAVTLLELPSGGWLWKEHDRRYKSAATALRAIRLADRRMVHPGGVVVTVLTWEPCSDAGRIAVKAIAD